ncbi:MAG: hypothetical protein Q9190_004009 [Brigantiaea leucoxantha]
MSKPDPIAHSDSVKQDLWMQALDTLSVEDRKQFDDPTSDMLGVLQNYCYSEASNYGNG